MSKLRRKNRVTLLDNLTSIKKICAFTTKMVGRFYDVFVQLSLNLSVNMKQKLSTSNPIYQSDVELL